MSPPELLSSLFECAGQKRFMDAAMLSGISGAFAAFDALRVADENGRQMGTILRGQLAALTAEAKTALSDEVTRVQSDKSLHRQLCERVREIGAPTYAPKYMTESALAHPTASPDGLVPGFNASAAWGGVASSYLGCSLR